MMGSGRPRSSKRKDRDVTTASREVADVVGYRDSRGRVHIGWRGNGEPATEYEQVTGWSYADGQEPRHRGRCGL